MTRLSLAVLACLCLLLGGARAAVVTLGGQATYGTNAAGVSSVGFDVSLDTSAATARGQGGFVLNGVSGTVTVDGQDFAFTDARVVATQRNSGRNVLVLRLGDVAGQANLRLTLIGDPDAPEPDFLSAVLAAAGYDTLRFQADGPVAVNVDSETFSAAIPLPPAAILFAGPALLLARRSRA